MVAIVEMEPLVQTSTLVSIYFNGAFDAQGSRPGHPISSSPPEPSRIGGSKNHDEWFHGFVDQVRIYSRKLTDTDIKHNFENPANPIIDGLALWLSFDVEQAWPSDKSGHGIWGQIFGVQWTESR